MAQSLSHKFGQIIGDLLEIAILPHLEKFAIDHNLFLDKKGKRNARTGLKLTWVDSKNNKHDLDFVLERGGSEDKIGVPVAFIESAWRRYTKHSRNKAQEIQGAIMPLVEKYRNSSPFIGVVFAGEFTEGSLNQLKSLGFGVLYFSYDSLTKAFNKFGIDASYVESTTEKEFKRKIDSWYALSEKDKKGIALELLKLNKDKVDEFIRLLTLSISRFIERVIIFPMHGRESISSSIEEAIHFINHYSEEIKSLPVIKYEVSIRYNTGDRIEASFNEKKDVIDFLENYL